jgi:tripartite ATP-independent transporter DctP family solute receptor
VTGYHNQLGPGPQRTLLRVVFALVAVVSAAGVFLSSAARPELTIKIAFLASEDDEDYAGSQAFKEHVESRSGGRIAVDIYPSGKFCGNERECIEALQSGVLEVHMTTAGGFGIIFPPGQVLDMPYAFADDRVAECVLDGPFADDLRDAILARGLGLRLMAVGNTGGWRSFANSVRPIRSPDDIKGLKIRTTPAAIEQEMVRMLGGNPTPVAWSELYTAFATGVVDGTKNGVQDIVQMKFHDYLKFLTRDRHAYMSALWWFSEPRWDALSDADRALITEAFAKLEQVTRELPRAREAASLATFVAAGGEIIEPTPEQRESFRVASAGMRAWFEAAYGPEWLAKLDQTVATCRAAGPAASGAEPGNATVEE